jgi:hypothetical protein
VVEGDTVWLRTNDHVRCFDPASGTVDDLPFASRDLSAAQGVIWTITPDGHVARVDRDRRALEPIGRPKTYDMHTAHGFVWTVEWRDIDTRDKTTRVSRIDTTTGEAGPSLDLFGSPQWIQSDADAVWVYLWRHAGRTMIGALVRIDPAQVVATGELLCESAGAPRGVVRGELWTQATDPYDHAQRGLPTTIQRLDARTGRLLGEIELPGWLSWPVTASDGLWGLLEERERYPYRVVYLPHDSGAPSIFDFDSFDMTPFLPPPPGPIDAEEMEGRAREQVAAAVHGGWIQTDPATGKQRTLPFIRGVTFEEVRLEGRFPETTIVVVFRAETHPGVLFGRRRRLWADDGAWDDQGVFADNLMEDIEACRYGLPVDPVIDRSGIAWF